MWPMNRRRQFPFGPGMFSPRMFEPPKWRVWLQRSRLAWRITAAVARAVRWVWRRVWARRRILAPVLVGVALQLLAMGLGTAEPRRAVLSALLVWALPGPWVAWRLHKDWLLSGVRLNLDDPDGPRWLRFVQAIVPGSGGSWRPFDHVVAWGWASYLFAGGWLVVASAWTWGPPMSPGVLWLLGVPLLGAPWFAHYRSRSVDEMPVEERRLIWQTKVAAANGPIPGSMLGPIEDITVDGKVVGCTAIGELPDDGKITCADVMKRVPRVALSYRTRVANVALEPADSDEAHLFRWSMFSVDPLERVVPWAGPAETFDSETGVARVGRHRDGTETLYRFWRPGWGPVHDLIMGTTGAGKSEFLNQLLAVERASPLMASFVVDPQMGQSLPEWKNATHGYARGPDEGMTLLRAIRAEMFARNEYLSDVAWTDEKGRTREGIGTFDPPRHTGVGDGRIGDRVLPMISLTVDEAPEMLRIKEAVEIIEQIGTMIRKCGGKLRLVSQGGLLDQLKSRVIRKMVISGNVFAFRTEDPLDGGVVFGRRFAGDPTMIPAEFNGGATTAGMGYALGPGASARQMRTDFTEDAYHWATTGRLSPFEPLSAELRDWMADAPGARSGRRPGEAATPIGSAASVTAKEQILSVVDRLGEATTGTIAREADVVMSTASTTLGRLADEDPPKVLRHPSLRGMWCRVEDRDRVPA